MQVQKIENKSTNFGVALRINNNSQTKIEKPVIEYLEKQFPRKTKNIKGRLEVSINAETGYAGGKDVLSYCNGNGCDTLEIDFPVNETKESLLNKLVSSLKGFIIREKAQNKIAGLKTKIDEISHNAYSDSANEFRKSFFVYEDSLRTKDIAERKPAL